MTITLTISGLPSGGVVGGELKTTVRDCWLAYTKIVTAMADGPLCVPRSLATWKLSGMELPAPDAWYLTLSDQ